MASSDAATVQEYLAEMPEDRRVAIEAVRATALWHLPDGFDEVMRWGMITYEVPLERSGPTYNGQPRRTRRSPTRSATWRSTCRASTACPSGRSSSARKYLATGKRLDMGKSCVRFTTLDQLPLELVGDAIGAMTVEEFVAEHHH